MQERPISNEGRLSRRDLLKTVGGAAFVGSAFTGLAAADGHGQGKGEVCRCPSGTRLVAKYEVEDGSAVFSESQVGKLNPSDNFQVSVNGNSFSWNTVPYNITHIGVKVGGPEGGTCHTIYPASIENVDPANMQGSWTSPTKYDISHIVFCAPVYWQIDFANEDQAYVNADWPGSTFLEGIIGYGTETIQRRVGSARGTTNVSGGSASVAEYTVPSNTQNNGYYALASYEIPGVLPTTSGNTSLRNANIAEQELWDSDVKQFNVGEKVNLSVDLP